MPAFLLIAAGEGGPGEGAQQLVTFSDYNIGDDDVGNLIETNGFQEQTVGVADAGSTRVFAFDANTGDLTGVSTP
jgi:hypothetical protein